MKELVAKGKWWVPNNTEKRLMGTLRVIPYMKTTLDVIDDESIKNSERPYSLGVLGRAPKIIIGDVISSTDPLNKQITLFNSFFREGTYQDVGGYNAIYEVGVVFNGVQFLNEEQIKFNTLNVEFTGLHEWVNKSLFKEEYIKSKDPSHLLKYSSYEEIKLTKSQKEEITLSLSVTKEPATIKPRFNIASAEIIYKQNARVNIFFSKTEKFGYCLDVANHLRDFLTLLIFKPVKILSLRGYNELTFGGGEIFNKSSGELFTLKTLDVYDILILYKNIQEKLGKMLQHWLNNAEKLQPVCDFYFSTFQDSTMTPETKFLRLIIAFEAYQSNFVDMERKKIPTFEFRRLKKDVIKNFPEYREFIEDKLSNRITLREELKELLKSLKLVTNKFIPEDEWSLFFQKVISTRNYLIHHSKEPKKNVASKKELRRINQQLKLLLLVCLLKETGLELENINTLLKRSQRFTYEMGIIWPG